jgi:uncharacterized YccA/Bax inhibitor family protein
MRSSNPVMTEKRFNVENTTGKSMTLTGTAVKTFILLLFVSISALFTWNSYEKGSESVLGLMIFGALLAFVVALVIIFKPKTAPVLAPVYAILEGLALGGISAMYEEQYGGIVLQAILITFGVLFALLIAYTTRLIKPTENLKLGIVAATGGIAIVYVLDLVLGMFGWSVPFIHDNGVIGIIVSVVIVIVAALNFVLDFDFIETGVAQNSPKYMEWYASFGLLLTIVWLYLEILRLLSKIKK